MFIFARQISAWSVKVCGEYLRRSIHPIEVGAVSVKKKDNLLACSVSKKWRLKSSAVLT